MVGNDFTIIEGWDYHRVCDTVVPGQGHAVECNYRLEARATIGDALPALGEPSNDIYLNADANWSEVSTAVLNFRLCGNRMFKKWILYRDREILDCKILQEEARSQMNLTCRAFKKRLTNSSYCIKFYKHNCPKLRSDVISVFNGTNWWYGDCHQANPTCG